MKHSQCRTWYRLNEHQREAAVEAELNRPLTPAELADLEAEIREASGPAEEETPQAKLELVWSNPHAPREAPCG